MNMRQLTKEEISTIYMGAAKRHFPAAELKPLAVIENLHDAGNYEGLGLYEEDKLLAYAFFIKLEEQTTMLLDYYAVMEEHRNGGMGSIFLNKMKEFYQDKNGILLETEDPACAQSEEEQKLRNKRNAFYLRNGAGFTDIQSNLFHVPFNILYLPIKVKQDNAVLYTELENIYRVMLKDGFERHVKMRRTEGNHTKSLT